MFDRVTEGWIRETEEFNDFVRLVRKAKSTHRLHPIVEERLASLLAHLYPNDCAVSEVSAVLGGRNDLMQFSFNGRRAVFELFFSPSQVSQDLRLLELANAEVKVAILLDQQINSNLAEQYFHKKPDHFPYLWLSDLMLSSQEEVCLGKLHELVDEDAPVNQLRRILISPIGKNYESSIRRQFKRIEADLNTEKTESKKQQKLTGGQYVVLQIITKFSKMGIPADRLRSLDTWLQKYIESIFLLIANGLQVFLKTDLLGHHVIYSAGDFADDFIVGGDLNDRAYLVICLNKIINDFLEANGRERVPLQTCFYHTNNQETYEMFMAWQLEKNRQSGIDTV